RLFGVISRTTLNMACGSFRHKSHPEKGKTHWRPSSPSGDFLHCYRRTLESITRKVKPRALFPTSNVNSAAMPSPHKKQSHRVRDCLSQLHYNAKVERTSI